MFTIADGREHFFQWDSNRQIIVSDPTIDEVHFCNKTDDCSLVVEVEEIEIFADNKPVGIQRYVNVPNILLQEALPIRVYAYCVEYTKVEQIFKVCPRTKPDDYVYTEIQYRTWQELVDKADDTLDKATKEANKAKQSEINAQTAALDAVGVVDELNTYLDNHKLVLTDDDNGNVIIHGVPNGEDVNLDNYYTKEEVDEKIENVEVDLTGYATETYVQEQIEAIDIPDPDLSQYYTKSETDTLLESVESPPEVHIGTTEPTDENIKVWINPDEPSTPGTDIDLTNYVTTDTDQEITGTKTFTSRLKVTNSSGYKADLSSIGLTFSDSTAPGVGLSRDTKYGLKLQLTGSGYVIDDVSKYLSFYPEANQLGTLGKSGHPWEKAFINNLSDGTTTKSMTDVLSSPTMDEVNQAIQNAVSNIPGGGSSEGGAKVVILNRFDTPPCTDEDKARVKELCEYYCNNNRTFPDTVYYIDYYKVLYTVESIKITEIWNGNYEIHFYFTVDGEKYSNHCRLNSDYSWNTGYILSHGSTSSSKDWQWVAVNSSSFYLSNETSHIKLIVQYDSSDYFTYEISSRDGNSLSSSYDTYQVHRDDTYENVIFSGGDVSISNGTIQGYYYWG